jgi:hypothetical protein
MFAPFEASTMSSIHQLLKDVEQSAAPGLKERAKMQGDVCLEEARVALKKTLDVVRETMNSEQKEVSRCLAPHVQAQLVDGYDRAMEERGTGSVARQKVGAILRTSFNTLIGFIFIRPISTAMSRIARVKFSTTVLKS